MLPDGTYDVIVVDAEAEGDDGLRLELTLLDGPHKGEVVSLRATGSGVDELDALGTPGPLTVTAGAPSVGLEPYRRGTASLLTCRGGRSAARRVGQECGSTCRVRCGAET